ncbi:carotenoid oxygenase [Aspergillus pseudoustus]|uniref:Carotenoid oxygenase n=1 Tax=Aspergillus pseudoustus TaxID=1810923 RepID=A0ABR4KC47_9EURO
MTALVASLDKNSYGLADQGKSLSHENHFGLPSKWEPRYPNDHTTQGRFEYQMDDLVVYGRIPNEIEGTWYRAHPDSRVTQPPNFPFIDGVGFVSALRINNGGASIRGRYVETERYLLERKDGRRLFGRYRNPYDNHPCLQLANDSTANTNVIHWAGDVLAISERGLPYAVNPDTLETRTFDPYGGQVSARTFTAHPKVDPLTNKLVTFAITAKGLQSDDIVTYSIDTKGRIENEFWFKQDNRGWSHDCWVTENWIVLSNMPFTTNSDEEMMTPDADYWKFVPGRAQEFLVAPRYPGASPPEGWKEGDPFTSFNIFDFWNPDGYQLPEPKSDYVRWTIELQQPSGSKVSPPKVLYPRMCEFPRFDDRFLTRQTKIAFLVGLGGPSNGAPPMNKLIKLNTETGEMEVFNAAPGGSFEEPAFVPRSPNAPEGDGYLPFHSSRPSSPKSELILLDTNEFSRPVAVIQLPWADRNQVHGSWVPNPYPDQPLVPLGSPIKDHIPSVKYGPLAKIQ